MPGAKDGTDAAESRKPAAAAEHKLLSEQKQGAAVEVDVASGDSLEKKVASSPKLRLEPLSSLEDLKPQTDEGGRVQQAESDEPEGNDTLKDISTEDQELLDKKTAERQANYDKLTEAKTYFLPINQVVRRRSKRVTIIGIVLSVLLGIAWLDVSLDSGIITIPGVETHTHFFSK